MKRIKAMLEATPGLYGYRVSQKAVQSYELFFVHKQLETVRSTDTLATDVTVYVANENTVGDSTFHVYASMTDDDLQAAIQAAVARAALVRNQPYELPAGETLQVQLPTNMADADPKELGRQIADAVYAADTVPGGSINALEIFLYRDTLRVINSRGVDKTQTMHRVMLEAIPTFTDREQSVELYEDYRFTVFEPAKLTAEIAEKMQQVADRAAARKPEGPLTLNVILRPHEIRRLIGELARDCAYQSIYAHANLHAQGDSWQNGDGDKLTVTMKAVVPGSERSAHFDEDGAALTDTTVIEKGVVCGSFGPSRFGQYLGIAKPSGNLQCVQVAPGTLTRAEMEAAPYLDCVSMSGLQLDLYNDYIGGEIRLAYYFDGQTRRPVTGVTMSAKLSDVLGGLRLSAATDVFGPYQGPDRALLPNVAVL